MRGTESSLSSSKTIMLQSWARRTPGPFWKDSEYLAKPVQCRQQLQQINLSLFAPRSCLDGGYESPPYEKSYHVSGEVAWSPWASEAYEDSTDGLVNAVQTSSSAREKPFFEIGNSIRINSSKSSWPHESSEVRISGDFFFGGGRKLGELTKTFDRSKDC